MTQAEQTISSPPTDAPENPQQARLRSLKKAWISSLLIRPLSLLTPLVTIPLFLQYLGQERYGLFESVGAVAAWLSVTNLGLTFGLQNRLVQFVIKDDREGARKSISTIFFFLAIGTVIFAVLTTIAAPLVDWAALFKLESVAARREAPWAFWFAGIATLGTLIMSLPQSVYFGYQELHKNNVWDGIARVVTFVCCFAVTLTGWGTVGAILAISVVPTLIRAANTVVLFTVEKPFLRPSLRYFDRGLMKDLLGKGIAIFSLQFACTMLYQMDKVIIGVILGSAAVTAYAVLGKLFLIIYGVFMMFLYPLWAAYGEALGRGDVPWVLRQMRRTTLAGCGLVGISGLVLLFTCNWILSMLPGHPLAAGSISRSLILAMTAAYVQRAYVDSRSTVLLASDLIRPQIFWYCGHFVVYALFAIPAAYLWGVEGVAWSTPVSGLLTSTIGYHLLIKRYIVSRKKPAHEDHMPMVADPLPHAEM